MNSMISQIIPKRMSNATVTNSYRLSHAEGVERGLSLISVFTWFWNPPHSYEAEYSRGERQTQVVVRSPSPERVTTWTGEGFMEVHEGDKVSLTYRYSPFSVAQ
jgi:hypothetical protein